MKFQNKMNRESSCRRDHRSVVVSSLRTWGTCVKENLGTLEEAVPRECPTNVVNPRPAEPCRNVRTRANPVRVLRVDETEPSAFSE